MSESTVTITIPREELARMLGGDGLRVPTLAEIEERYVVSVVELTGGNQSRAAELLGINRNTVAAKLAKAEERARTAAPVDDKAA